VEAAVDAGKNVFMEKPVAVDPVGVRRVHDRPSENRRPPIPGYSAMRPT